MDVFFTWHVQALEAAEDSLWESHRAAPSALGAAGQETRGQQREGAPQETGLQARAGQEGWMHLEEWWEGAVHTAGVQLMGGSRAPGRRWAGSRWSSWGASRWREAEGGDVCGLLPRRPSRTHGAQLLTSSWPFSPSSLASPSPGRALLCWGPPRMSLVQTPGSAPRPADRTFWFDSGSWGLPRLDSDVCPVGPFCLTPSVRTWRRRGPRSFRSAQGTLGRSPRPAVRGAKLARRPFAQQASAAAAAFMRSLLPAVALHLDSGSLRVPGLSTCRPRP